MRYHVLYTGTAQLTTTVTADSVYEAIEEGTDNAPALCNQCSGQFGTELAVGDEWDAFTVRDDEDNIVYQRPGT